MSRRTARLLDRLAQRFRVVAPRHPPAFGHDAAPGLVPLGRPTSPYLYLDLLDRPRPASGDNWSARPSAVGSRSKIAGALTAPGIARSRALIDLARAEVRAVGPRE